MDKVKGLAKSGWHPSGDRPIHRDSWKSDIRGMATGKKKDPYAYARDHQSQPLNTLQDPDSFGPPPKHRGFYETDGSRTERSPTSSIGTSTVATRQQPHAGGLGGHVPVPRRHDAEPQEQQAAKPPPMPYRVDTTGLRTDHLPPPPLKRNVNADNNRSAPPTPTWRNSVPGPPQTPPRASRPGQQPALPMLPPRMNDHPDEYTPAPPPPYRERGSQEQDPATTSTGAISRLGQAGVSVPGFGIGNNMHASPPQSPSVSAQQGSQLSELQQRFSRMNRGGEVQAAALPVVAASMSGSGLSSTQGQSPVTAASLNRIAAVAQKRAPPPPPPKRASLQGDQSTSQNTGSGDGARTAPPLPLASKPRPF